MFACSFCLDAPEPTWVTNRWPVLVLVAGVVGLVVAWRELSRPGRVRAGAMVAAAGLAVALPAAWVVQARARTSVTLSTVHGTADGQPFRVTCDGVVVVEGQNDLARAAAAACRDATAGTRVVVVALSGAGVLAAVGGGVWAHRVGRRREPGAGELGAPAAGAGAAP